jgi:hypothetical protein
MLLSEDRFLFSTAQPSIIGKFVLHIKENLPPALVTSYPPYVCEDGRANRYTRKLPLEDRKTPTKTRLFRLLLTTAFLTIG